MKHHRLHILLLLCITFLPVKMVAQSNLSITNLSDQELADVVYTIGKIVLEDDSLYLVAKDGTILAGDNVAHVRSLVLVNGVVAALPNVEDSSIVVYPNPTKDVLMIKGATGSPIRVFDLNGRCLITTRDELVHVQYLPNGTYLLQVNTKIVKFIKN